MRKISWTFLSGLLAALAMIACGGSTPVGPSGAREGLTLQGAVLGGANSASAQPDRVGAMAAGGGITVTVQGSAMSTSVSSNGTFQLSGLPQGFTLVFSVNGKTVGTIMVNPSKTTTTVHIVVQVTSNSVTLVSENDDDDENQPSPSPGASPSPKPSPSACLIEDGRVGHSVELGGTVTSGTSASFMLSVHGEEESTGTATVTTSATTKFSCGEDDNGTTGAMCAATLKTGSRVHVNGMLTACTATTAAVTATQVGISTGGEDD
jgi:hypothetical protein